VVVVWFDKGISVCARQEFFFSVIVSIFACLCSAAGRGVGGRGHGVGEKGREETEAGGMQ